MDEAEDPDQLPALTLYKHDEYWEAAGNCIVFGLERRVMIRFTVDQLHKPEPVEKQKKYYHPTPWWNIPATCMEANNVHNIN